MRAVGGAQEQSAPSGLAAAEKVSATAAGGPGKLKIVSVPWAKLQEAARKELYKEREQTFRDMYGMHTGGRVDGAGFFTAKVLSPEEVKADPIKQGVRDAAAKQNEEVMFLRTNTKAEIFGSHAFPINTSGPAQVNFGLRLGGVVEIVETRAIPRAWAGAWDHLKERVFMWPLSAQHLRETMRVGEDITLTLRVERGSGLVAGIGKRLGVPRFGGAGAVVSVGTGHSQDDWVSLHIKKLDPDHVRIFLQKGNGEVFSVNLRAMAGFDMYDDAFIPRVAPNSIDGSVLGQAVVKRNTGVMRQLDRLVKVELSEAWSRGKHESQSEGWGSVSLSDPKSASALDKLFRFDGDALRGLAPESTYAPELKAGRIDADMRDVTEDKVLQAKLLLFKVTKTAGTAFYEVRWRYDHGPVQNFLVGIARKKFDGSVTSTSRNEESAMWYDLNHNRAMVSVSLGPQERLLTTTRERVNDIIAVQKALGLEVAGEVKAPHPYIYLFGLGNYGRSVENGKFVLSDEGRNAIRKSGRDEILAAYLKADWMFEAQNAPPGQSWNSADRSPAWAKGADPEGLARVLGFFGANAAEIVRLRWGKTESDKSRFRAMQRAYEKLAPGRSLLADAPRYLSAANYANHVGDMQRADAEPTKLIDMFLEMRRDRSVDLKRAVAATALLSGTHFDPDGKAVPNYSAYIEMTGKRVNLVPKQGQFTLPDHPINQLGGIFNTWK
ncbi:MAG: hypothetical protein WC881_06995 [Elusimicrobiota bacterium]